MLTLAGLLMIGLTLTGVTGCDEDGKPAKITPGESSSVKPAAAPGGSVKPAPAAGSSKIAVPSGAAAPKVRPSDETMDALQKNFRFDDFEQMIYVLKLTDRPAAPIDANKPPQMTAAEKTFRANMAARAKALADYKISAAAKKAGEASAEVRAEKDPAKKADLEKKYASAIKADRVKMEDFRRIVMGPLSADQKAYWAQYVCYRSAYLRFSAAKLTDAQKDKLWAMAADCGKKLVAMDYVGTDPYLTSDATKAVVADCVAAAYKKVLADDQKKTIPDPAAPKTKK